MDDSPLTLPRPEVLAPPRPLDLPRGLPQEALPGPDDRRHAVPWLTAAAVTLAAAAVAGVVCSVPHGWPPTWSTPLRIARPLHSMLAIGWIFLAYLGALIAFTPAALQRPWPYPRLLSLQYAMLLAAGLIGCGAFFAGMYTGREYLEMPLVSSALVLGAWALVLYQWRAMLADHPRPWPAWMWQWCTGLVLFPVTFIEAHLYLLPHYGDNVVRDMAVQWKSYGSLIGSWNMVVYGLSLYLAGRLARDPSIGRDREAYFLYLLGLFNLMFGFAHHTYPLPQSLHVREIAYAVSMTEWAILVHLLWTRLRRPPAIPENDAGREIARRLLLIATAWVMINLTLALLISIPALNALTHGTQITIAHAMGSTIGINTMILLAAGFTVLLQGRPRAPRLLWPAVLACHAALFGMLVGLVGGGLARGWTLYVQGRSYIEGVLAATPWMRLMAGSGAVLCLGLLVVCGIWLAACREASRQEGIPHASANT